MLDDATGRTIDAFFGDEASLAAHDVATNGMAACLGRTKGTIGRADDALGGRSASTKDQTGAARWADARREEMLASGAGMAFETVL